MAELAQNKQRLYLRFRFDFTTINPFESADLGKMLHIFAASMGILQILPLIFANSTFPCIIAFFEMLLSWKLRFLLIFSNPLTHLG